jgi:hypothetical protein
MKLVRHARELLAAACVWSLHERIVCSEAIEPCGMTIGQNSPAKPTCWRSCQIIWTATQVTSTVQHLPLSCGVLKLQLWRGTLGGAFYIEYLMEGLSFRLFSHQSPSPFVHAYSFSRVVQIYLQLSHLYFLFPLHPDSTSSSFYLRVSTTIRLGARSDMREYHGFSYP